METYQRHVPEIRRKLKTFPIRRYEELELLDDTVQIRFELTYSEPTVRQIMRTMTLYAKSGREGFSIT